MTRNKSTAHISVVQNSKNTGSRKQASIHHRFLFIGEPSLQVKILAELVSDEFELPADIVSPKKISVAELSTESGALICLDCLSLKHENIAGLLDDLDPAQKTKIILVNVRKNSKMEKLGESPYIVGIFHSNIESKLMLTGIRKVLKGGLWLPRSIMESLILNSPVQKNKTRKKALCETTLTRREIQILEKLVEGRSNTKIADSLFLSEHTVKTHLYNIYKKVNVSNRTQACNWMQQYSED